MYFPYLRGKNFEFRTLRESTNTILSSEKIIPILEPVQRDPGEVLRVANEYVKQSVPLVLVVNPDVGQLKDKHADFLKALADQKSVTAGAIVGFLITSGTTISAVERFQTQFHSSRIAFIHWYSFSNSPALLSAMGKGTNISYQVFIEAETGSDYRESFSAYDRVIIRDGFRKRHRNVEYPADEFFSELHRRYSREGFQGFGDFTIVGSNHSDRGGATHAVAIHLTYPRPNEDVWIRHFLSDRVTGTKGIPVKFFEALEKLIRFLDDNPEVSGCDACTEFRDLHRRQHFPGLGSLKRLSMKHHLDLMRRLL